MSAKIIPFSEPGRPPRRVLVIDEVAGGRIRVGVSPEATSRDRDFARHFPDAAAARRWAAALRATYPNVFVAVDDAVSRGLPA